MADPAQIDITADRRVFYSDTFTFFDLDLTGCTFKIQARLVRDTTGTPLLDFTTPDAMSLIYAGTATVAAHVTAGRLSGSGSDSIYKMVNPATDALFVASDSLLLSQVGMLIDVSDFPFPDERGDDLITYYDVLQIPAGGPPDKLLMRGRLTVRAGVTLP